MVAKLDVGFATQLDAFSNPLRLIFSFLHLLVTRFKQVLITLVPGSQKN